MQGTASKCVSFLIGLTLLIYGVFAQSNCLSEKQNETPKTVRADLYRGQQAFTVSMLQAIQRATPSENVFFSPYSTFHALLLAYFGAQGTTEEQLTKTLGLQWAKNKHHIHHGYRIEKITREARAKKMPLEFVSADKIYFDKSVKLTECTNVDFVNELQSLDFRQKSEQSRQEINAWIANITRNEIPEMLNPDDISSATQMVLANAAYFKGKWASQFDPKLTKQDIFYTSHNKSSFVNMMHKTGTYNLAVDERLKAHILQMPYLTSNEEDKDSEISMIIILPTFFEDSVANVLAALTPDSLDLALNDSMPREIEVSLPKFEFEQNLELLQIFNGMGITSIFDESADLSGFSIEQKIHFGDAKHVAKIKVDEEGSTASAATLLFSFRSARPIEPTKFECNHPFIFLIYDHSAKAALFAGIYRDPKTMK